MFVGFPAAAPSSPRSSQFQLNLRNFRNPLASDTRHPLYRAQAERWMRSIVVQDVSCIGLALDPAQIHEQVLAQAADQRGILDLLCVTRWRRLAILELKATENLDLPLQAADYWSRIRRHGVAARRPVGLSGRSLFALASQYRSLVALSLSGNGSHSRRCLRKLAARVARHDSPIVRLVRTIFPCFVFRGFAVELNPLSVWVGSLEFFCDHSADGQRFSG